MRSDFQLSRLRLDARFTHETLRREVRVAIAFFLEIWMSPLTRTIRELCFVRGAAILCAALRPRLWRFDGAAALSQGPGRVLLAMLVVLSFASITQATSVSYALRVTTLYEYGVSDHVAGPTGSPETGFARFTNVGISTLSGTFTLRGTAPNGGYHETAYVGSIAPNANLGSLSISYESSNDGGYNKVAGQQDRGIEIRFDGTATVGSISSELHLEVFDADVHSGVLRTNPFGVSTDAYVLQGGDPYGRDTGDDYELSQADGVYTWSMLNADCNSDGIVDSTQCRDGSLPDYNGNDIPDCCEQGTACVVGSYPVQWRVADGGNGHWYAYFATPKLWREAEPYAESLGGHLVTIGSVAEANIVRALGSDTCWIGLFQDHADPSFVEPAGGWKWVTGEPLEFTNWRVNMNGQPNEPNNLGGGEDWAHFDANAVTWNDIPDGPYPFAVEYDADCNNDGLIDYGQILNGQLADADANGVPDICETLRVPQEYPTIQAAVDVAGNGATVLVGPGSYAPFDFHSKLIVVRSSDGAAATTINAGGFAGSAVTFGERSKFATTVRGFTIRTGSGTFFPPGNWRAGGGCYLWSDLSAYGGSAGTIEDCNFVYATGGCGYGAGIWTRHANVAVRRCRFDDLHAEHHGPALSIEPVPLLVVPEAPEFNMVVEDCYIGHSSSYNNGGMLIGFNNPTAAMRGRVSRCEFDGNHGLLQAGALLTGGAPGNLDAELVVEHCVFHSNSSQMSNSIGVSLLTRPESPIGFVLTLVDSVIDDQPTAVRKGAGAMRLGGNLFCGGTAAVVGAWTDLGSNTWSCPPADDCDQDGVLDIYEIGIGAGIDTNGNWILDACECAADIDGDGFVGSSDLSALLTNWSNPKPTAGDINGDGAVDAGDLSLMLASWGACR